MFSGKDFVHIQGGEEILKFLATDIAIEITHNQEAVARRTPLVAGRL